MDNARVDSVYVNAAAAAHEGRQATLVVVTEAAGHTPQVVGARMLVWPDGRVEGTVGGGRFEQEVAVRAQGAERPALVTLHLGAELGMCCGGRMQVLVTPIRSGEAWLQEVASAVAAGRELVLRTALDDAHLGERRIAAALPPLDGERRFEHAGLCFEEEGRALYEHLRAAPRMVLFGAGHVSRPTAQLATLLGYRVVVVDDRPEWNSAERFPQPAERVLEPYEDFLAGFDPKPTDALLIITRGHDFDQVVLEAVVRKEVAYLGMIGSRTKVHKAVQKLRSRGVDEAHIARLHAPVGLTLGALTPEEIAVAIAAELVAVRRSPRA